MSADLPDSILIGKAQGEWPIQAFENDAHAIAWMEGKRRENRRPHVWRCRLIVGEEMTITDPVPPRLVPAQETA